VFNLDDGSEKQGLALENTLWCNTVLANGKIIGMVIYTGNETRMSMSSKKARYKFGLIDKELNFYSKLLFAYMILLSMTLIIFEGFGDEWYVKFLRYILLLSSIIPISLRVNLDFAKLSYTYFINHDVRI